MPDITAPSLEHQNSSVHILVPLYRKDGHQYFASLTFATDRISQPWTQPRQSPLANYSGLALVLQLHLCQ